MLLYSTRFNTFILCAGSPNNASIALGTLVPSGEGSIPHFAVYVDDLDKTAADLKAAGIISFTAPEKKVLPNTFGGLQNWFFTGPSGEQIELLQML